MTDRDSYVRIGVSKGRMNRWKAIKSRLILIKDKILISMWRMNQMDYKDLNVFEIVERSIMQCKEENDALVTPEAEDFFMESGLNDNM